MNKAARNFVSSKPSYFQSTRGYKYKCGFTNTILDVLRARGWQEVRGGNNDDTDWDFYWCDVGWMREVFDHLYLEEHMRVCHFRNHYELTRKNLMVKNFKRFRKQLDREFGKLEASKMDFFPASYELPTDYHMFVEEFKRQPSIWIMKPANKSQGKGIFLFRRLKDIVEWKKNSSYRSPAIQQTLPGNSGDTEREIVETYVVSKYIDNPYLIGGKKFDIRYYVLVVSYTPLKVWQYREGFARFSYSRYSLDCIEDTFVHLTNVAIQKLAPEYDPEKDCKWSIESLRTYLTARHGLEKVEQLMRAMDELVIYSLKAVQKTIINDKHCFELYGFDILLDANLKPWLLEVNASPSLTASSPQDYALKTRILDDMLNVVDMEGRLTGNERGVGGYDLIWNDGPVTCDDGGCHFTTSPVPVVNSFLGCRNDRDKQLRQLFKHSPTPKKVSTIS